MTAYSALAYFGCSFVLLFILFFFFLIIFAFLLLFCSVLGREETGGSVF